MATYRYSDLKPEYARLWGRMSMRPEKVGAADAVARRILARKEDYLFVSGVTGVPWIVVGIIHAMECGLDFSTHLHNGDPLTARTVQVPKGRPATGTPPFTWVDSAVDALESHGLHRVTDWCVERAAYELERYNGWGYRNRGVPSAYLWSYSNNYTSGKYVRDGVWDPRAVSRQCGAMVLLWRLMLLDTSIIPGWQSSTVPSADTAPADTAPAAPAPAPIQSEEVIRSVQRRLRELGYAEVGNIDGDQGPRTRAGILAFRADNELPLAPSIDADLLVALAGAKPREIPDTRSAAPAAAVATKVPAAKAARGAKVWAWAQGIGAAVVAAVSGVVDQVGTATDKLGPVKDLLGAVPVWAWALGVVGVSYVLWRASHAAERDTVQAYRDARIM